MRSNEFLDFPLNRKDFNNLMDKVEGLERKMDIILQKLEEDNHGR
jgi:hypothetical protein